MKLPLYLLAKLNLDDLPLPQKRSPSLLLPDIMIVLAGCLVVTTLVVLWAVFIRKPRDMRSDTRGAARSVVLPGDDVHEHKKRKRHRRRRREHRSRNPTLSETGGLPPSSDANPAPEI